MAYRLKTGRPLPKLRHARQPVPPATDRRNTQMSHLATPSAAQVVRRRRFRMTPTAVLLSIFAVTFGLGVLVVRDALNKTIERQALAAAEIVASQAATTRSVYARVIADKLLRDGFGQSEDSDNEPGHVPIAAQFLTMVGRAASSDPDRRYEYRLVSKWNLEPTQGLSDDFLRWAWPQLEAQDSPSPQGPLAWRAVSRIEAHDGGRVLRYLMADPASQRTCVTCHRLYETRPEVIARRVADGVTPGKQWQQHQLMGALAVTIPLDNADRLAGSQVSETSIFVFGILATSFAALVWFNGRPKRHDAA